MLRRIIGIDPGLDGAVAVLTEEGDVLAIHDAPTVMIEGKGKRREYLPAHMAQLLEDYQQNSRVVLERVHSMPHQGVRSMFSMGVGTGLWLGIVAALRMPCDVVTPQRWKKTMMDGMGKEKDASRLVAMRLFPTHAEMLKRKKDHGRADALLLAEYGRRHFSGEPAAAGQSEKDGP